MVTGTTLGQQNYHRRPSYLCPASIAIHKCDGRASFRRKRYGVKIPKSVWKISPRRVKIYNQSIVAIIDNKNAFWRNNLIFVRQTSIKVRPSRKAVHESERGNCESDWRSRKLRNPTKTHLDCLRHYESGEVMQTSTKPLRSSHLCYYATMIKLKSDFQFT